MNMLRIGEEIDKSKSKSHNKAKLELGTGTNLQRLATPVLIEMSFSDDRTT